MVIKVRSNTDYIDLAQKPKISEDSLPEVKVYELVTLVVQDFFLGGSVLIRKVVVALFNKNSTYGVMGINIKLKIDRQIQYSLYCFFLKKRVRNFTIPQYLVL